jgi:hypothetical protein
VPAWIVRETQSLGSCAAEAVRKIKNYAARQTDINTDYSLSSIAKQRRPKIQTVSA